MLNICKLFGLLGVFLVLLGCESQDVSLQSNTGASGNLVVDQIPSGNLVEIVNRIPDFSFFANALEFTGFNQYLGDESANFTFTVPTNAAFNSLSNARREELLSDREAMANLVLRHVAITSIDSATLTANGAAMLDGSSRLFPPGQFVLRDVQATNGILHGINVVYDRESVGPGGNTVIQALSSDNRFTALVAALQASNLTQDINAGQNITLFAPTNRAVQLLGRARVEALYANPQELRNLLSFHLIPNAALEPADFGDAQGTQQFAANGGTLTLANINGVLQVNNIRISPTAISASNGVIYVIDTALQP